MVTPFEELRIDDTSKVVLLDEPEQMANPKQAFTDNPYAECAVHLTFTGQGRPSMFGGEPDTPYEAPGEEFAKGHDEQRVTAAPVRRLPAVHHPAAGDEQHHDRIEGVLRASRSGKEWRFSAEVMDLIPLRNGARLPTACG